MRWVQKGLYREGFTVYSCGVSYTISTNEKEGIFGEKWTEDPVVWEDLKEDEGTGVEEPEVSLKRNRGIRELVGRVGPQGMRWKEEDDRDG